MSRFEREVDPQGALPPAERERRAAFARRRHFTELALKSALARARKANDRGASTLHGRSDRQDVSDAVVPSG
jgi:hypothetical protein